MNDPTTEAPEPSPAAGSAPLGEGPPAAKGWHGFGWADLVAAVAVAGAFGFAYAPNIGGLIEVWNREPDYSHGFLVLPIALVILWKRWTAAGTMPPSPWPAAWAIVAAALVARAYLHERGSNWLETASLLPVLVGLVAARLGWRFLLKTWPAFAFLVFWLPLPPMLNAALSQPLQSIATTCSCKLLRLSGLWVMPEGNVILVGNDRLEVAAACNGLSMLMSLAATVAATVSLVGMANWKRAGLLMTIIPIALVSNVLRIVATAWCYHRFGSEFGAKYAHDWAGWLMMPTAMGLVFLELVVASWVIVEAPDAPNQRDGLLPSLNYKGPA